jgi:hypothetical protein
LALVASGPVKLAKLRARPQVTATFRNGWQWAAVEGRAELAGPDDPQPWLDTEGLVPDVPQIPISHIFVINDIQMTIQMRK